MSGHPHTKNSPRAGAAGAQLLSPHAYMTDLSCPDGCQGELFVTGTDVCCRSCQQAFTISDDGILEMVRESGLDEATAQELRGHQFNLTPQQIVQWVRRERAMMWQSYYSRNRMKTMQHLAAFLDHVDCSRLFFLGAGTGREIEFLLSFRKLQTVLCSDLSASALRVIPARLQGYGLEVGLFTSDLQRCPVANREIPIVIVNALHHTQEMHVTLERLLEERYENLFIVEPTNNFIIRLFARLGVARRREYSGVIPGRLDLPRLKAMCSRHGYRLRLRTEWEFPRDYYRKIFGRSRLVQRWFFRLLNDFSMVASLVQFGNFSVVHISRSPVAGDVVAASRADGDR
jgi:hypothetical protein